MKLKKGDSIIVLTGKDKGKKGTIEKVFPKRDVVLVPGINVVKRHTKKKDDQHPAGIFDLAKPIAASKVALVDKKTNKATRIGFHVTKGEKVRIARKSGDMI
jgi:large subunit ribosomal protein L24